MTADATLTQLVDAPQEPATAYGTTAPPPSCTQRGLTTSETLAEEEKEKGAAGKSPSPKLLPEPTSRIESSLPQGVDISHTCIQALKEGDSQMAGFIPIIRSGVSANIGKRWEMEDEYVQIDNLVDHFRSICFNDVPSAYYGVFDGHNGKDAALFVKEKLLNFIVEDLNFPTSVEQAVRHAFFQTDTALAKASPEDQDVLSGTTAITCLILGSNLLVANVGDCRAVLSRRGKAVEMSRDHKPESALEKERIEALGGFVFDGYLNGELSVARALGNWHMKNLRGVDGFGLLSSEPELRQALLTEEDEFLIIGCDGLWDVMSSQNAVEFARKKLQEHNDPQRVSQELVDEALQRETRDNLTVVVVCFHACPPPQLLPFSTSHGNRFFFSERLRARLQGLLT